MVNPFKLKQTCLVQSLSLACAFMLPNLAYGQTTGHYPAGVEGIKAASLPPPGFYIRDYNIVYFSDRLNDKKGDKVPLKFHVASYVNGFRAIWMTEWKIFGADYGMDVLIPLVFADVRAGAAKDNTVGLGDIYLEPLLLAWHPEQTDLVIAYGFWAPTGHFNRARLANPGKGFGSHMLTFGITWYPDKDKVFAASFLNRYEIHTRNHDLNITPGDTYTLEWGLSRNYGTIDVGLIGYYQQQVDSDHGRGISAVSGKARDRVFAVGPEVNVFFPKLTLFASLRYNREFSARDRPEGNTLTLTLTKRW